MNSLSSKVILALILLLTFMVFYPVVDFDFTNWDDPVHLTQNFDTRAVDLQHIKNIFTHSVLKIYIPLTTLSFAIEHQFFGYEPFIYHLDNLLLHLGSIALVFFLGFQLGLNTFAVVVAAFLFAVHPIHVESIAWVTERKDMLYAFFYL